MFVACCTHLYARHHEEVSKAMLTAKLLSITDDASRDVEFVRSEDGGDESSTGQHKDSNVHRAPSQADELVVRRLAREEESVLQLLLGSKQPGNFQGKWAWRRGGNAHTKCALVLRELLKVDSLRYGDASHNGSFDTNFESVQLFSLLDQGKCELAASLGKAVYRSGESAKLQYSIRNSSLMHVRALKVTLYQDLYLQLCKRRNCEPISRKVARIELAGVNAESEVSNFLSLALQLSDGRELSPSTNGVLVKCHYRMHVQCDIRWCPDPFIDLPIVVAAIEISSADSKY